jgi:hypothetical protein
VGRSQVSPGALSEAQILKSPRVRDALINAGVRLTNFAELAACQRASVGI